MLQRSEGRLRTALAILDPMLLLRAEFVPGDFGIYLRFLAGLEEVLLALFPAFPGEWFDSALLEREEVIWDGLVEIDSDDASEAPATLAGTERGIEGKERRGGLTEGSPGGGEFRTGNSEI